MLQTKFNIIVTNEMYTRCENKAIHPTCLVINDARVAAFNGIGQYNLNNKPAVLFIEEAEIGSLLTGLTEAKYQYIPMIVVMPTSDIRVVENAFISIEHKTVWMNDVSNIEEFIGALNVQGLTVVCYEDDNAIQNNAKREEIVQYILGLVDENSYLIHSNHVEDSRIINREYNYGLLSTFFGYALRDSHRNILVIDYKDLQRDINTFGIRYKLENIIVIVLNNSTITVADWINDSGYDYHDVYTKEEMLSLINQNDRALVLNYIEKGE